jgi:membrane protease YdiL (CAAX protease family)
MTSGPWAPRVVPFFVWIVVMAGEGFLRGPWPWTWPILYAAKCLAVGWLLWRYRRWIPEVNWRFHWTVLPSAVFLLVGWICLGWWMAGEFALRLDALLAGDPAGTVLQYPESQARPALAMAEPTFFQQLQQQWWPAFFYGAVLLKLIGMGLLVPMFEELFTRSALLRALNKWHRTKVGIIQFACDVPILGERVFHTRIGEAATREPPALTEQLKNTTVGVMGATGVIGSTVLFASWHAPRDWPGAVLCGLVWCLLLWWTNRGDNKLGLGPVIWSHALVNALLWGYTLWSGDWQFL